MSWLMLLAVIPVAMLLFVYIGYRHHVANWNSFVINVLDGWVRIFCRYYHRFVYQPIPVSEQGATLLACNHLSGLDPFLVVAACHHPIRFMMAREEYERFGLQWLFRLAGCIPVERSGRVETAFRATLKALQQGEVVALFPEGAINRSDQPLRKLKPGIIRLAHMARVPITVLRVDGMRRQGETVLPIFLPSHSCLRVITELDCVNKTEKTALQQLAQAMSAKGLSANDR